MRPVHPGPDEPLASQRADLEAQLDGPRADLEAVLADLIRDSAPTDFIQSQLQAIVQIQRQIGTADAATLATLPAAVAGVIANAQTVAQLGRATATGNDATEGAEVARLASRVEAQASSFMRDQHQYDQLLQFDSDEDREAYELRAAERRRRYEEEAAKGTPEGQFHSGGAAFDGMGDLAVHGGSVDPALIQRMDKLGTSLSALRANMPAAEVEKFDQQRRDSLRAIMRSKNIPEAEIDAFLAAHLDPIEATRQFVRENAAAVTVKDLDRLDTGAQEIGERGITAKQDDIEERKQIPSSSMLASAKDEMAVLLSMGLTASDTTVSDAPAHGVAAQIANGPAPSRSV